MTDAAQPKISAVVFDFDGTLVDSLKVKYEARFELFADESEEVRAVAAEVIPQIRGKLRAEIIRAILERTHPDLEKEAFERKVLDYAKRYDELVEDRIVSQGLFPGTREMLDSLRGRLPLYVNSGTPDYALRKLLERLDIAPHFKGVYGIDPSRTEGASVVKRENMQKIVEQEGGEGNVLLVVGDGTEDFDCAQAHGARFIGILTERSGWKEADVPLIKSVAELADHSFLQE